MAKYGYAFLLCLFNLSLSLYLWAESSDRLTLNLKGAEIGDVLSLVQAASKLNVVQIDKVTGTLNLSVTDKPWDTVLDEALGRVGGYKVVDGRVIKIYLVNRPQTGVVLHSRRYTSKIISIDLDQTPISHGLKIVEQFLGIELKGKERVDLNKEISVRLLDVPADQALDIMLEMAGAGLVEDGDTFRIISFPGMAHG